MTDFEDNTGGSGPLQERCWYEPSSSGGRYWHQNVSGKWVHKNQSQFRRWLVSQGLLDYIPEDQKGRRVLSEVAELLTYLEGERVIDYAGPIAGHAAGLIEWNRRLMLVTDSTCLIDPVPAEGCEGASLYDFQRYGFPILGAFLDGLLNGVEVNDGETEHYRQIDHFLIWLWHFIKALGRSQYSTGLALAIAGEPDCGKTLTAAIIKAVTGGVVAKPYEKMTGGDNFNEEWLGAPLLLIDDESSETGIQQRLALGAEIKKIVATQEGVRIRGLQKTAIQIPAIQRLLICVNLEPERLQVLPPIDGDIRDKILILKGYSRTFPMPSETLEEREAFWAVIEAELPHFVWYLTHVYDPPRESLGRFGGRAWQHPQVFEELGKLAPEARTFEFIERLLEKVQPLIHPNDLAKLGTTQRAQLQPLLANGALRGWIGSVSQLRSALVADGDSAPLATTERREVRAATYLGRDLDALSRRYPRNILSSRQPGTGARHWVILEQPLPTEGGSNA